MSTRPRKTTVTAEDLHRTFDGQWGERYPPILSPADLADLLRLSRKTIYEWISKGRLDGAFRRRGKHVLIWRDRAIDILFNGKDWTQNA